ncbi:nucleoside hydrolase [Microlunatus sp. Gsoil 973]|uniref:nucleoside hydrolase n=1 Tax=Microlunatus sp. Gsoil 973 TaxID=2672569 RepID=UPI0012B4AA09|nr:nucleoside hydrolase [Microlunatus sp. Gsoil 973]QGN32449.1 nucleoside hydrolase [Microlunatus sp. Gsoil 973]
MNKIILDTDLAMGAPGSDIDDGFALALAHADPELQLELVSTVNGNTDVDSATVLSLELLRRLGVHDVPVVKGAATPLIHPETRRPAPQEVTGSYGIGLSPAPGYAPALLAEKIMAEPGEIDVVAIGPLTNVAAALAIEPGLASAVKEIVIMGGVFLGITGESGMPGEFNVWSDPEAAAAVLRSGARQRWVGLDVTLQVRLTRADARRLSSAPGDFAPFAGAATQAWIDHQRRNQPGSPQDQDSCAMHDPLAVAAITHPELITWADARVDVITGDVPGRGMMITDLLRSANPPAPNARIAVAVDASAFTQHFLNLMGSL